jgi:MFS family permease
MNTNNVTAKLRSSRWGHWSKGLNRNVLVLGLVSLFTDISSEMLVPIRFLFLVRWLGTPLLLAALVEGIAEAAASLLKVAVGKRTDRVSWRTPMILLGYSMSNLAKPLIGFVQSWLPALGLLLVDRTGKAIRGAPRDTLIADSVPEEVRGKAFGFHRSMDTLGAALGPLLTVIILNRTHDNLPAVFRWTIVPGVLAILVIPLLLREPKRRQPADVTVATETIASARLGWQFWLFTLTWTLFSIGNSSDAFIFLRSVDIDTQLVRVPLYYAGFNIIYALAATPLGALSDRIGRLPLLLASLVAFALVYIGWGLADQPWQTLVLFLCYGLYYAATEGVARAFVADLVPQKQRGTAFGWFMALTGLATLPANLMAAYLWNHVGKSAPFLYGASFAFVAALVLVIYYPQLQRAPNQR